jgi:hypothetical protein
MAGEFIVGYKPIGVNRNVKWFLSHPAGRATVYRFLQRDLTAFAPTQGRTMPQPYRISHQTELTARNGLLPG